MQALAEMNGTSLCRRSRSDERMSSSSLKPGSRRVRRHAQEGVPPDTKKPVSGSEMSRPRTKRLNWLPILDRPRRNGPSAETSVPSSRRRAALTMSALPARIGATMLSMIQDHAGHRRPARTKGRPWPTACPGCSPWQSAIRQASTRRTRSSCLGPRTTWAVPSGELSSANRIPSPARQRRFGPLDQRDNVLGFIEGGDDEADVGTGHCEP